MTEGERRQALVPLGQTLPTTSRLAERTLAERARHAVAPASARTLIVGPDAYPTITAAVSDARDGDVVLVQPGRYTESVVVDRKAISIRGPGDLRRVSVTGTKAGPTFSFRGSAASLEALSIRAGPWRDDADNLVAIAVHGGGPKLERLSVAGGAVAFDESAVGSLSKSTIFGDDAYLVVSGSARPLIDRNVIRRTYWAAVQVDGAGTSPTISSNRVTECEAGIFASDGALPSIIDNKLTQIAGTAVWIDGVGTDALVRSNQVRGCDSGISITNGASPRVEENVVWAITGDGISVSADTWTGLTIQKVTFTAAGVAEHSSRPLKGQVVQTAPRLAGNSIGACGMAGIAIRRGATPMIEGNRISDNKTGVSIDGSGTNGILRDNRFSRNEGPSISFDNGASGTIEQNSALMNKDDVVRIAGAGTFARVEHNSIISNQGAGVVLALGATGQIVGNQISGNDGPGILIESATAPRVAGNDVSDCECGLVITAGSCPVVEGNRLSGNRAHGVVVRDAGSAPTVRDNRMINNGAHGIAIRGGAAGLFETNTVGGNARADIAIWEQGTAPIVSGTTFIGDASDRLAVSPDAQPLILEQEYQ